MNDQTRPDKVCPRCRQTLPRAAFYSRPSGGPDCYCMRCRRAYERERGARLRRERNAPKRHQRYNARGEVWCNNCERYLAPENFKRHPLRPHTFWAYCRVCTRELDRVRQRATSKTAESKAAQKQRSERRQARREAAQRDRRLFVQTGILTLRKRGLTKTEICRLAQVSFGNLLHWERLEQLPNPAIAERIGVLLRETMHLPMSPVPAYRRQRPHAELAALSARIRPSILAIPVRSRWKKTGA